MVFLQEYPEPRKRQDRLFTLIVDAHADQGILDASVTEPVWYAESISTVGLSAKGQPSVFRTETCEDRSLSLQKAGIYSNFAKKEVNNTYRCVGFGIDYAFVLLDREEGFQTALYPAIDRSPKADPDDPVLFLYPPKTWHGSPIILGTKLGLELLQSACNQALSEGYGSASVEPGDGELGTLMVQKIPQSIVRSRAALSTYLDDFVPSSLSSYQKPSEKRHSDQNLLHLNPEEICTWARIMQHPQVYRRPEIIE